MKRFGLIGKSLVHSFSKRFFEEFFQKQGIEAEYLNLELPDVDQMPTILRSGFNGLNVTIPYKEKVIPYLDELSAEAMQIGAVNTISFKNGKTIGHNTDAYGFHQSIKPFLTNRHERAIILGTGGASKAVIFALERIGVDTVVISRQPGENRFSWNEINEHMLNACKLIVNCTPLGTFPNVTECPELPYHLLSEEHLLVDLVYNPPITAFMDRGKAAGAQVMNGESMLKLQAMKAWELWSN